MSGRLELIIGPMYASKSTELIKIANRYKFIKKNIIAINHTINNRYGTNNISTHDNNVLDNCLVLDKLQDLKNNDSYNAVEIILIEELQFFSDAYDFITEAVDKDNKIIIAAGLSGDFNRQPFGDVLRLIPHAEQITKLSALCQYCSDGTLAHFSKLTKDVGIDGQILVGGSDKYEAVCRKHYLI